MDSVSATRMSSFQLASDGALRQECNVYRPPKIEVRALRQECPMSADLRERKTLVMMRPDMALLTECGTFSSCDL